jgi:hypothetical protein
MFLTPTKRFLSAIVTAVVLAVAIPATASADVVRNGNTFTAVPSYCSCWSTIDGYQFYGIPYSPFVRDVFLKLPVTTPVAVDIWWELRSNPKYLALPPVTSGSVEIVVSGEVEDTE